MSDQPTLTDELAQRIVAVAYAYHTCCEVSGMNAPLSMALAEKLQVLAKMATRRVIARSDSPNPPVDIMARHGLGTQAMESER